MWRLLLLLGGCDRVFALDDLVPPAATGDGGGSPDATRFTEWSTPTALTALNSTAIESDPSITADGLELFYTTFVTGSAEVRVSRRASTADPFPDGQRVDELTAMFRFGGISPDGLTFWGNQLVGDDSQIFRATRTTRSAPFEDATFEPALSTPFNDINPGISSDGLTLIVTREMTTTDDDLWVCSRPSLDGTWSCRELGELNSTWLDSAAATDANGLTIFFHSDRTTHDRASDLYTATRPRPDVEFVFVTLQPVSELNTSESESDPSITPDARTMVWISNQDIYMATRAPL